MKVCTKCAKLKPDDDFTKGDTYCYVPCRKDSLTGSMHIWEDVKPVYPDEDEPKDSNET